jgi:hypothetical protein
MASFPLVSATGMLGSGFRAESLDKAISLGARMIVGAESVCTRNGVVSPNSVAITGVRSPSISPFFA